MVSPGYQGRIVVSIVEEMTHMNAAHAPAVFNEALECNYSPVSWLTLSSSEVSAESFPRSGGMAPASEREMDVQVGNKTEHLQYVLTHG